MAARNKRKEHGLGPNSAGQSGDNQQMSDLPDADSESVEELAEEFLALADPSSSPLLREAVDVDRTGRIRSDVEGAIDHRPGAGW